MPVLGLSRGLPFYQMYPKGLSFSSLLKNCGGLVGDYGQAGRPILDRKVLELDGVSQHARDETLQSFSGAVKISSFLFFDSSTTQAYSSPFAKGSEYRAEVAVDGTLTVNNNQNTGVTVPIDTWFSLVIEYDSSGNVIEIWVDGISVFVGSISGSINTTNKFSVGGSMSINGTTVFYAWKGKIAFVAVQQVVDGSCWGSWLFYGTGLDSSGNGRHLTLINNPSFVIDNSAELADYDVVNTIGYSNGRSFNGVDQYVETGQTIKPTDTEFHASMWIKPNDSRNTRIFFSALHSNSDDIRLITDSGAGDIDLTLDDGSVFNLSTGISPTINKWIFVSFGFADGVMYFQCPQLSVDVSRTASFDFSGITDGRVALANRADGSLHAECSIAHASINGTRIDLSDDSIMVNDPPLLVIPPSSNNDGLDALGNPLDVSGSAYPALPVPVGSKALSFNGSGQYVDCSTPLTNLDNVVITFWVQNTATSGTDMIFSLQESSTYRAFIRADTRLIVVRSVDTTAILPDDGELHEIAITIVGSSATSVSVDDEVQWVGDIPLNYGAGSHLRIGASNTGGQPFKGSIAHLEITGDTNLSIPFNNHTPFDLASDGSLVNYINNPTQVDQDVVHREIEEGFTLYFDTADSNNPIRLLYVNGQPQDDTNAPASWVKQSEHPAIPNGHNDANTGFNRTHLTEGGNTPPAITATGVDDQNYRFGDSLVNPSFKRVLSPVGEDRHSLFSEVLTGACLEKASNFFSINFIVDEQGNIQFDEQGNPQIWT